MAEEQTEEPEVEEGQEQAQAAPEPEPEKANARPRRHRRKPSKRHVDNSATVSRDEPKSLAEAVKLLKACTGAKFDETVEIAMKLGIDPKQSDQQVRGTVILPRGTGQNVSVLVFAESAKADEAREAGADWVGSQDLVDKIQKEGWTDFDVAIATPDMMRIVGRLGKVLGPHGKMPSPKAGTLTMDVAQAVKEFKAGKIEYRNDKLGNVACPIGKKSFSEADLLENLQAVVDHLEAIKPPSSKGIFIRKAFLSSTMGPGIPLAV